jgi:NhaP-type Na+/H+ or K+/H+ antiporter
MEHQVTELAALVVLGIGATWLSWRLRVPSILLLLVAGFIAGPISGFLNPDVLLGDLLFPLVSLSVAVILFEGGLSLNIAELRDIGRVVRNLATAGVLVTWIGASALATLLLGFDLGLATLLGAILVVTGPTVIVPLLRFVRPSARVGSTIKWEGIVNDPIGAILAVLVFEVIVAGGANHLTGAGLGVLKAVGAGTALGLLGAVLVVFPLRHYWIPDSLQSPAALAVAIAVFTASNLVQTESGLLAVTVMGSTLASQKLVPVNHIVEFKENLRVLLISLLFIVLAARVQPEALKGTSFQGVIFLTGLIVIVRPLAVLASTWTSNLTWRERAFLSAVAPRGIVAAAVASIFTLELTRIGYPDAERLISITFLVVVGTVAVYGLTAAPVARRLGVASPNPQGLLIVGADAWVRSLAQLISDCGFTVVLVDSNWTHVAAARRSGIRASYGNILAEQTMHELELDGIGRLLAMTSNDEVNSLAALHFGEVFGRSRVFQLPVAVDTAGNREQAMPRHLRGRSMFGTGATHREISERFSSGAVFKRTTLTEEFGYDEYRVKHGETAVLMFLMKTSRTIDVVAAADKPSPKPGHTLISLVGPDGEAAGGGGFAVDNMSNKPKENS